MSATAALRPDAPQSAAPGRVTGLSVCIPVLNEERAIGATLERCLGVESALRSIGVPALEVIVVDDGSQDGTAAQVRRYPRVRLVQHPHNRGYGAALKTGFAAASHELIGFIDADSTYPPEHFPELCRTLLVENADHVVGSRMAGAISDMPLTRRMGNVFFAGLLSALSGTRVTDSASGMRVFRHAALGLLSPLPDGLNLTPVMSTRAAHEGLKTLEVPIPYRERVGPSHLRITTDGVRFLQTMVWTALTYNPVRPLGLLGLAAIAVAVLIGAGLVTARVMGVTTVDAVGAYAVFLALVMGVTGVGLFALGAAFNYLVSLFYRRPIRQGLFGRPIFVTPIERYFLPLGAGAALVGVLASMGSLVLAMGGWPLERFWLYLIPSAMLILIGVQLCMSWLVMSILRELSDRAWADRTS
jgi:hypothetical protein